MLSVLIRNKIFIQTLIVFLLPVLLYLQSVKFSFTGFDDYSLIISNAAFLSDFKNAPQVFLTDAFIDKSTPFYRPLQTLSYMLDIRLSGGVNFSAFHITNVILIGLISCALFILFNKLLVPRHLSVLASLLYCVHPLFISSVAWVPARGDLLLTFFALLSFGFLIDYLNTKSHTRLFLHLFTFTLALFCKETAALLPAIFIFYYLIFFRQRPNPKYHLYMMSYVFLGLCWYALRSKAIFNLPSANAVFGLKAIASNIRSLPEAMTAFFIPFELAPIPYFSNVKTVIGILIIISATGMLVVRRKGSWENSLFGLFWFITLLFPALLFKHHLIDYLNHRFLLPLVGILLLIVSSLPKKWFVYNEIKSTLTILPIIAMLAFLTFKSSRNYNDPMSFHNAAILTNPKSALAFNNRGILKIGIDNQGAIDDFNKAIEIYPDYEEAHNNRGQAKLSAGNYNGAIADFDTAIAINKDFPNPYYYRGRTYFDLKNYSKAIADFSTYTSLTKESIDVYNYIGKSLAFMGNFQEAINNFSKAIEMDPNQHLSYVNRSIVRLYLKDYAGVIEDCNKALALKSDNKEALNLKAKALYALSNNL